jgi:hypothetical protein
MSLLRRFSLLRSGGIAPPVCNPSQHPFAGRRDRCILLCNYPFFGIAGISDHRMGRDGRRYRQAR